jgi:hypothetical protein
MCATNVPSFEIDLQRDVCAVPYGTRVTSCPSRHCRAGLQVVPSLRDCFVDRGPSSSNGGLTRRKVFRLLQLLNNVPRRRGRRGLGAEL